MNATRTQRLVPLMQAAGNDALLVTDVYNIRYLLCRPTLFDDSFSGALLVSAAKAVLLVDYRYLGLAAASLSDSSIEVRQYTESLLKSVAGLAEELGIARPGYEAAHLSAEGARKLMEAIPAAVATSRVVEVLRAVKDDDEIESIRAAAALADSVFPRLLDLVRPGATEAQVAFELEMILRKQGAEAVSFDPIIAGGPNSAFPHACSGDRVIGRGDLVKLDYGCRLGGYCSDMTRMAVVGRAGDEQRALHAAVLRAHDLAIDSLRAGMSGVDADRVARDYLKESGLEGQFGHGLGHGVGLRVHEKPSLAPRSRDELLPGMVFTIEPGMYRPGFGGVRIEDMVVLGQNGVEVLTTSPRELVEL